MANDKNDDLTSKSPSNRKGNVKKDLFSTTNSKADDKAKNIEESVNTLDQIVNETKYTIKKSEPRKTSIKSTKKSIVNEDIEDYVQAITTGENINEVVNVSKDESNNTIKKEKTATKKVSKSKSEDDIKVSENSERADDVQVQTEESEEELIGNNINDKGVQETLSTKGRRKVKRSVSIEDYNIDYVTKSLSQTIHESMIPYSEFVIMDRALPRVEDGLKPVQRRVLYSMLEVGVLPDRPYKKSASIVGECMGKYHPHGDSSIYETLVRMAQPFNMCEPLVDGHGNFGSVDGDSAAAMRYTEAKLTPLALELLRDLEKDTVSWGLNFDDRLKEPNTLPGRFPNLLVNGCQGIAVGLATNIPTHNMAEACNAVIAYIDSKGNISLEDLLKIMPGPDFPSGGYILDTSEIEQVYKTGKGKIYVRSKFHLENADNGKKNIVITEIPYQVNKANMLQKIAKYKEANPHGPLSQIYEIVDESDRHGTRAVIKLKKDAKINSILNILYKYCDLQTTFGANIVAIADGKPKQMGLIEILDYYVKYQQKVIFNRTNYDLEQALKKEHVLEGLLIAIRNIDEVVRIIKTSKNVTDAKINLMKTFELSDIQAQAILDMRLARLTSLEVNKLITDLNRLRDLIKRYTAIVKSPALQMKVVKSELQEIIKSYGKPRKTKFIKSDEHFEDGTIVLDDSTESEDIETYHFIVTPMDTLKLINLKSYNLVVKELSSNPTLYEVPKISFKIDNNKELLLFTNIGNCIRMSVKDIPECKFRDKGTSLFNLVKNTDKNEHIVAAIEMDKSIENDTFIFVTKLGMVKISKVNDYNSTKHIISAIKLGKGDELKFVELHNTNKKLTLFSNLGNAVKIETGDISVSHRTSIGIKGIALEKGDYIVGVVQTIISDAFTLFMSDGSAKIIKQAEVADSQTNRKGLNFIGSKSKEARLVFADRLGTKQHYVILNKKDKLLFILNNTLPLDTRTGGGKVICKDKISSVYKFVESK